MFGLGALVALLVIAAGTAWLWLRLRRLLRPRGLTALGPLESFLPSSNFITVDGVRIHYVQAGSGRDVVLLHGIGASIYIWRYLFPILQKQFRTTALDIPGFGKSGHDPERDHGLDAQADIVAKALDALGIDRPILVGSSMGGAIALWLAKIKPDFFPRVVAIAPATDHRLVPALGDWLGGLALRLKPLGPLGAWALNRHTMRLILAYVIGRPEVIDNATIDAYLTPFRESGSLRTFWAALKLLRDPRLPRGLSGLGSRVLLVYGCGDRVVPRSSIDALSAVIPEAKLALHPSGGHHLMECEPAWMASQIIEFVASEEPH